MIRSVRLATAACAVVLVGLTRAQDAAPPASAASSPTQAAAPAGAASARSMAQSTLGACVRKPPSYPVEARRQGLQGQTVVGFVVGADGRPEAAALLRSSGHAVLDRAAVRHLARCIDGHVAAEAERLPPGRYALPLDWRLE